MAFYSLTSFAVNLFNVRLPVTYLQLLHALAEVLSMYQTSLALLPTSHGTHPVMMVDTKLHITLLRDRKWVKITGLQSALRLAKSSRKSALSTDSGQLIGHQ